MNKACCFKLSHLNLIIQQFKSTYKQIRDKMKLENCQLSKKTEYYASQNVELKSQLHGTQEEVARLQNSINDVT